MLEQGNLLLLSKVEPNSFEEAKNDEYWINAFTITFTFHDEELQNVGHLSIVDDHHMQLLRTIFE